MKPRVVGARAFRPQSGRLYLAREACRWEAGRQSAAKCLGGALSCSGSSRRAVRSVHMEKTHAIVVEASEFGRPCCSRMQTSGERKALCAVRPAVAPRCIVRYRELQHSLSHYAPYGPAAASAGRLFPVPQRSEQHRRPGLGEERDPGQSRRGPRCWTPHGSQSSTPPRDMAGGRMRGEASDA